MVVFSDGKSALLPLSAAKRHKGLVREYHSSPGVTYGGWIALDSLTPEHCKLLTKYLTQDLAQLIWRVNPYDSFAASILCSSGIPDETHALDLSAGYAAIYNAGTKGHTSAERKARKDGVAIEVAGTVAEWRSYYDIYQDSIRRWGENPATAYPWKFFENLFYRNSSHVQLWLANYQGELAAGALCFYSKSHVVYWHGAAAARYFTHRPVNLLLYEVIRHACESNYSWFDFNPSGGHEGVKAFKQHFGATSRLCPVVKTRSRLGRMIKALSFIPESFSPSEVVGGQV
jgi:hypothetical protein